MKNYLNIPSGLPLSKSEAYKIAKDRFDANNVVTRENYAGIVYQAGRGIEVFVEWADLPEATHDEWGKLKR